jgi:phage recombination protein Bet
MNTEIVTAEAPKSKPSALMVMSSRLSVDPDKMLDTLKQTVFKGASNAELIALTVVSNEYGLNPFLKEIYAFPAKGGGIVPVVSVDGWISMINRQANLDGIEFEMDEKGEACTCRIYVKDRSRPVVVTEYLSECARKSEPWTAMPKRMLRHKSLIQCARVAFGFSGIYDEDEAAKIKEANARTIDAPIAREEPLNPFAIEDAAIVAEPEEAAE